MIVFQEVATDYTHDGVVIHRRVGPVMVQFEDGEMIGDERLEFYVRLFFMCLLCNGVVDWKNYPWPLGLILALRDKFAKWR